MFFYIFRAKMKGFNPWPALVSCCWLSRSWRKIFHIFPDCVTPGKHQETNSGKKVSWKSLCFLLWLEKLVSTLVCFTLIFFHGFASFPFNLSTNAWFLAAMCCVRCLNMNCISKYSFWWFFYFCWQNAPPSCYGNIQIGRMWIQ